MPTHNAVESDTSASLWADAFDVYNHRTGIDLRDKNNDFALRLHDCDSEGSVLDALEKTATDFGGYREGSPKWHKFRQKLKPVITAVTVFIDAAAEGAASKSVPGGKSVFVAIGILLKATQGVSGKFDALVDLLESLGLFLRQLKIRSDVPFGNESKIVVVEILVEILKALALATQMMKKNRIQHFVRELFKADDMKAVLDRLNKLTTIESRMTVAEMLMLVNQGQAWQVETSGVLGQIEQATSSLQKQHVDLLARLSELPDNMELQIASIVEQRMQHISERYTSVTQPQAQDNALVIRLDYACIIPSRAHLNFLRQLICSLIALSTDEKAMIRRDMAALLPVLTTTGLTDIEGSTCALSSLAAAINPTTAIGLYTQTILLYIAAYVIWRLIVQITGSIPSAPGIDTKHTIVIIDILGLEFRLPLDRCATFEDFHSLIAERASKQGHKSAAKYVLSRAYEVADGSNSAVIYPHIWARKIRAGMKLEMAVLLRRLSVACPWCGQENAQALWIHCDCGRTFEVSAASQMAYGNTLGERSTTITEELAESSQRTSLPTAIDSFPVKQNATRAEDEQDEMPFRKVHVIFDDFNMTAHGVQVWFQNRQAKEKTKAAKGLVKPSKDADSPSPRSSEDPDEADRLPALSNSESPSPTGTEPPPLHVVTDSSGSWQGSPVIETPKDLPFDLPSLHMVQSRRGSLPIGALGSYSSTLIDPLDPLARRRSVDASLVRLAANAKNSALLATQRLSHASPYHTVRASLPDHSLYPVSSRSIAAPIPGPLPSPGFSIGVANASPESDHSFPVDFGGFSLPPVSNADTDDDSAADPMSRFGSIASESSPTSAYLSIVNSTGKVLV